MPSARKLFENATIDFVMECSRLIKVLFDGVASYKHRANVANLMIMSAEEFMSDLDKEITCLQIRIDRKGFEDTAIGQEPTSSSSEGETSPLQKKIKLSPDMEFKKQVENIMACYQSTKRTIVLYGSSGGAKRLIGDLKYLKIKMEDFIGSIQREMEKEKIATAAPEEGPTSNGQK